MGGADEALESEEPGDERGAGEANRERVEHGGGGAGAPGGPVATEGSQRAADGRAVERADGADGGDGGEGAEERAAPGLRPDQERSAADEREGALPRTIEGGE